VDIARKVYEERAVDVSMGYVNVIWQGDANSICLRSFDLCTTPPAVLNVTGSETLRVQEIAARFGRRFGTEPRLSGTEAETALLNDASWCSRRFGPPRVSVEQMMDCIAYRVEQGGASWNKPTHFETRDGKF
jgi:hypothetical protein